MKKVEGEDFSAGALVAVNWSRMVSTSLHIIPDSGVDPSLKAESIFLL
jgi:hypothetical protein